MIDIVRDSVVGQLLRLAVRPRALRYPEEVDPDAYRRFISWQEKAPDLSAESSLVQSDAANEGHGDLTLTAQITRASRIRSNTTDGSDLEASAATENSAALSILDSKRAQKVVGWSGPDDQDNPQNWSFSKKMFVTIQICYMTFAIYVGAGIYSSAIPGVVKHFHVSQVAATLGLTCFVAGYGVGPMIWAPLGEAPPIGRAIVYIGCLVVFVCFQLGVIMAQNFGMLLAFRFLTGFFGSPVLATGGASMSDIWSQQVVSYAIGAWGAVAVCGPTLGPLLGGFAEMAKGWTWPMWILLWSSGLSLAINAFLLPETSAATILYHRARRIRKVTGDSGYRCVAEIEVANMAKTKLLSEALVRPFDLCFTEPVIFVINLYIALIYGILYLFFEAFPIVFEGIYGFNLGEQGLAWLGLCVGSLVGTGLYCFWIAKFRNRKMTPQGLKPEAHLPPALAGSIFITGAMLWFAWVARPSIQWMVPIVATAFFAAGACWVFNSSFTYIMAAYPVYAASALASNDFCRSMLAAGFPLFGSATFDSLGIDWATTMLGLLTAVFIPAPFIFYRYGGKLRKMSKRANHEMVD